MGTRDTNQRLDQIESTLEQLLTLFKGAPVPQPSETLTMGREDRELLDAYHNLPFGEYKRLHKRVMRERSQRKR